MPRNEPQGVEEAEADQQALDYRVDYWVQATLLVPIDRCIYASSTINLAVDIMSRRIDKRRRGMDMAGMKIGELAKQLDLNAQTVRYYERIGLLPEPALHIKGRLHK